jgi:hypothetical protein
MSLRSLQCKFKKLFIFGKVFSLCVLSDSARFSGRGEFQGALAADTFEKVAAGRLPAGPFAA